MQKDGSYYLSEEGDGDAKLSEKEDSGIKERKGIRRRWWVCFMEMHGLFLLSLEIDEGGVFFT
ncbi:hypothetical protein Pyn_36222 [Prunus yedoensis var. nudiflora]|uniref:Uncharacterized protein n=1 Tax=Prunus yedoensis var. nudiflora TaxID=2094558 RepID=A0A314Z3F5_PRUYE|nr:hypothetical protein Pyn_36222 [Prunus yedoensis var. nudiflora]